MQRVAPRLRVALAGAVLIAGCTEAPTASRMAVTGTATTIIGPEATLDPGALPPDWFAGPGAAQGFAVVERSGLTALEIRRADTAIGRRTAVPLLASPYLRWGWHLETPATDAGVRLVVGLARRSDVLAATPARGAGERIEIALVGAAGGGARVTAAANGGPPILLRNADAAASAGWLVEAIDLAALHRQLRPGGAGADLDIVFVAVGGIGRRGDGRALGQVAEIVLSR